MRPSAAAFWLSLACPVPATSSTATCRCGKERRKPHQGRRTAGVIDGGFCRAYHEKTGIAGYTLVYSSRTMSLRTHQPLKVPRKR